MTSESTTPKYDFSKILDYGRRKPREKSRYPSFNRRMLAVTIDSMLLLAFVPLINVLAPIQTTTLGPVTVDTQDPESQKRFLMLVLSNPEFIQSWVSNFMMQMLFWCFFSAVCWHFWAATPGKMLLRMKVVDSKTEGSISDLQIFLRAFGYLISASFFCLGFFWIGFNKKHRGWHDYLGDTVVISLPWFFWKKPPPSAQEAPPVPEPPPTDDVKP